MVHINSGRQPVLREIDTKRDAIKFPSVHSELSADQSQLCRCEEFLMCDRHAIELTIEVARPEGEELHEPREAGVDIVILPNVALKKRWMIRHAIKDLRRRETEAGELGSEITIRYGDHGRSPNQLTRCADAEYS